MSKNDITEYIEKLVSDKEIPCGLLTVRKNDDIVFKGKWGYSDLRSKKEILYTDIFRMMSMTKPVVAVGILKLIDDGSLTLDTPITEYLPEFKNMRVISDERFEWKEKMNPLSTVFKLAFFNQIIPKTVPAERDITVRDLLSHTSGLEQGVWGFMAAIRNKEKRSSLKEVSERYSKYYLDWQPGTMTSYSALAGFDVLTRLIEVISEKEASVFFDEEIFKPLHMTSTSFNAPEMEIAKI